MKKIFIFLAFMISLGLAIPVRAAEEVQSDFFVAGAADGVRTQYKPMLRVVAQHYDRLSFSVREYMQEDDSFIGEYEVCAVSFRKNGNCLYEVTPISGPISQYAEYGHLKVLGEAKRDTFGNRLEQLIQQVLGHKERFKVKFSLESACS